jgi:hypothetical protein
MLILRIVAATALTGLAAEPAWAYVGPGAGLSLLAAFWTLLMAVLTAIGFLVVWPLRRRLRRAKRVDAVARGEPGDGREPRGPETAWSTTDRRTR